MIKKYFINAGIIGIAEIFLRLRGLILVPFITRQFGPINYGVWSQVSVVAITVAPIIAMGTNPAALRLLPGLKSEEQRSQFSAWMFFLLLMASIAGLPILFWKNQIATLFFGSSNGYVAFLPLAILVLAVGLMLDSMRTWYRIKNDALGASLLDIGETLLTLGAAVLMLVRNETVYELVIYTIVASFVTLIFAVLVYARNPGWAKPDFSVIKRLLSYGIPLLPAGLAAWALNYSDRLIIVNYQGLFQIGVYSVAYSLGASVIELISKPLRAMLHPSLAELYNQKDYRGFHRLFTYSTRALSVICIPAAVGLLALGKPIISLVSTEDFLAGGTLIGVIAIAYYLSKMAGNYGFVLSMAKATWLDSVAMIVSLGVNLSLNFVLIPRIGLFGAAIATLAGFTTDFVLTYQFAKRYRIVFFDFTFIGKVLAAAVIMWAVLGYSSWIDYFLPKDMAIALLAKIMLGILAYLTGLVLFRIITKEKITTAIKLINIREL